MISVKDYLEREYQKMSWLEKAMRNYPVVTRTSFIGRPVQAVPGKDETIIEPSILKRLILLPFLVFAGFFYYWVLKSFVQNSDLLVPFIFGILLITGILCGVVWMNILNPRYNYKIILNAGQIKLRDKSFTWEELEETCIMTRMEGKYRSAYLLLFTKKNTIEKYDLTNLNTSHQKLASLVEYYKHKYPERKSVNSG